MGKQNIALDYALFMKDHGYGYPLYHPASQDQMRVLSIGYFNANGVWQKIASLGDSESLKEWGLSQPEKLEAAPTKTVTWEPKGSSTVKERKLGGRFGLDSIATAGIVSAKAVTEYSSSTDHGAILVTSPEVVIEGYKFQQPFEDWMKKNYKILINSKVGRDVRAHGLFIVTQTCATTACAITCWHGSSVKVNLEFDAGAQALASGGLYGGWSVQQNGLASWNHHVAPQNDKLIVFASGIQFNFNAWFRTYSPRFHYQVEKTIWDSEAWLKFAGFFTKLAIFLGRTTSVMIEMTRFQLFSDMVQRSVGYTPHSDIVKGERLAAALKELFQADYTDNQWDNATREDSPFTHFQFEALEIGGDYNKKTAMIDFV
ncbi:hypothetical protein GQ53DRAFT_841483 [Thozetella sp. PMI_491]|nr:hypothetical protein GQ53DRAFT_841483 [Thozetella sp. PMI_491]